MFAPSVDLCALAEKTEGFSGADLQALVYNAHLEVVHDAIAALPPAGAPNGAAAPNATNGDGPEVRYTVLGGEADEGQVRSRAEEAAFQRRVEDLMAEFAEAITRVDEYERFGPSSALTSSGAGSRMGP